MPISNPPRPQALNLVGHPVLYPCVHCGMDFAGSVLHRRHRAGRKPNKRCRSVEEMWDLGWWMDARGRWRQRNKHRKEWT